MLLTLGAHQIPGGLAGAPPETTGFKAPGEESGFGVLKTSAGECSVKPGRRMIIPGHGMQSLRPTNGPERGRDHATHLPSPQLPAVSPAPSPEPSQLQGAV